MSDRSILFEADDGYATITLNRPGRLNSFTAAMHQELRQALARVRADTTVRALLLTGSGRGFCAGQDLEERNVAAGAPPPDLGATIGENCNPLVQGLRELPIPVVCAVNGVAAGAGANVALACDIVLAARSASFIQAFSRIGLIPDSGGTYFLPRLVGDARARALAMLGERVTAEQAEAWGMIWKCMDDAELMSAARELARQLARAPTRALAGIKKALDATATNGLSAQLELERELQRELGRSEDYREGVTAFKEKRQPQFKGR
ncbi:MAG: 2-(1,2-epoxy-1,2-dihydrophenyl)acetyl-CoA isomerase PaaG [Burkholderiales bacterium]